MSEIKDTFPPYSEPDTSFEAARRQKPVAQKKREVALEAIRETGDWGLTDEELAKVTGMPRLTAAARRNELVRQGLVEDSGRHRDSDQDCPCKVWVAVKKPQLALLEPKGPPSRKELNRRLATALELLAKWKREHERTTMLPISDLYLETAEFLDEPPF